MLTSWQDWTRALRRPESRSVGRRQAWCGACRAARARPPVVPGEGLVVLVEIGHVGEGGGEAVLLRRAQARADRVLELTQTAAERELLLVVDLLVVEDQDGVRVHSGMDRRHVFRGEGVGHVDAFDFGGEARADLARDDGHGGGLPSCFEAVILLLMLRTRTAAPDCPPGSSCGSRDRAPTPVAGSTGGRRRSGATA